MVSGASLISKKNKRTRILKIIQVNLNRKHTLWIPYLEKIHPGSGSRG
jgi:hypothetical protein